MGDLRRDVLLEHLAQCIAARPAQETDDTAVGEIVADDLRAWYQQFRHRTGTSDVLYLALLEECEQRTNVLISSVKTVRCQSPTGLLELAALAVSIEVLETAVEQIDRQWDALEAVDQRQR